MKVTEIKKPKPKLISFEAIGVGEVFLPQGGGLYLKLDDRSAQSLTGTLTLQNISDPSELVGVAEVEIRYSEVCEQEEPDSIIPRGVGRLEALRLAACKRALLFLRGYRWVDTSEIPASLIEMLEEAVGPEWLEQNSTRKSDPEKIYKTEIKEKFRLTACKRALAEFDALLDDDAPVVKMLKKAIKD